MSAQEPPRALSPSPERRLVRALGSRFIPLDTPKLLFHGLEVRPGECQAFAGGRRAALTRREFEVLLALCTRPGRVIQKDLIHESVWGKPRAHERDRAVDVHVRKVRAKLRSAALAWRFIHTHFGLGYRFEPERVDG